MSARAVIELSGHIIDSMVLPRVMDSVMDMGATFHVEEIRVGTRLDEASFARLTIEAENEEQLAAVIAACQEHGASVVGAEDAVTQPAPTDGVFPDLFYTSTNQPTSVLIGGEWVTVDDIEMDCGVVITEGAARAVPVTDVVAGDQVVVGRAGVRLMPVERGRGKEVFGFTTSSLSPEKPKHQVIRELADTMREVRARNGRICFVGGPAIIHTGAGPHLARLIALGYVQVLFAGNGLAAYDIESQFFGTSLGIGLEKGLPIESGHELHMRTVNRVRAVGGIRAAVESGMLRRGVMFECIGSGVEYVLAGSVRDDGPLPDVVTDMVEARRRMRAALTGVDLCIMCASMLHAIATGNLLPAATRTVCVDINPAVVAKLADRGSAQTLGLVTDVESFLRELGEALAGEMG
jgi:lysine-ketoglutarate reductase/saccharopine dehydrogenase-like protein (TIGR00300 family)